METEAISANGWAPSATAIVDLLAHALRAHRRPELRVPVPGRRGRKTEGEAVLDLPFCTLRRFAAEGTRRRPAVVLVSPLSGHFAALLAETVAALVADHDVHLTDWKDAAQVPLAEGAFDLDGMIAYLVSFLRAVGRRAHLVGMSQSGVPILAAASIMAADRDPSRPRSMTLMGGLVDTRIRPTAMNRLARSLFRKASTARLSEATLIRPVGPLSPGAGRLVYPASAQFRGLALYLLRRLTASAPTPLEAFQRALLGDGAPATSRRPLYDVFLTLMDLPAELYLQTMRVLFADDALAQGTMTWRGGPVAPAAITDIGLMTVEAERDDISGPGQTRAAHGLCPNIPDRLRLHHVEPAIGHIGMFHGRRWRRRILPLLRRFVRGLE